MKVSKQLNSQDQSIELTIKIESKEELEILKAISGHNTRITSFMIHNKFIDDSLQFKSDGILEDLYNEINNYISVEIISSPISERYCKSGDICQYDPKSGQIRCSGVWFNYTPQWAVKTIN